MRLTPAPVADSGGFETGTLTGGPTDEAGPDRTEVTTVPGGVPKDRFGDPSR